MRLYIMRHGETDWNKEKRLQGKSDIPLNAFGRLLAKKTADGLADVPFDLVITSPLIRAKETALLVRGERRIPIVTEERLEEMSFGSYEGLCCKGAGFNIPDPEFRNFFEAPEQYRPTGGGETFAAFSKRVGDAFREICEAEAYADKTILLTAHGAVIRAILMEIRKTKLSAFWGEGVHKNCAVTIVDVEGRVPHIVEENIVYYEDEVEPW